MTLRNKKKTQVPQEANKPGVKQTNRQNFNEITNKSTYTTDYPDYRNKLYSTVKATTTTTNTNRHITPSTNRKNIIFSIFQDIKIKINFQLLLFLKLMMLMSRYRRPKKKSPTLKRYRLLKDRIRKINKTTKIGHIQ